MAFMFDNQNGVRTNKSGEIRLGRGASRSKVGYLARICNEV